MGDFTGESWCPKGKEESDVIALQSSVDDLLQKQAFVNSKLMITVKSNVIHMVANSKLKNIAAIEKAIEKKLQLWNGPQSIPINSSSIASPL